MPRWADERLRVQKLLAANIPDDEPCSQMRFPRRDAAKRIKNNEGRKRIVFPADIVTYAAFHEQKERIVRLLDDNPVLFGVFLTDVLKGFQDDLVSRWMAIYEAPAAAEEQADGDFVLGRTMETVE